jgi:hypothetical protein
VVSGVAWAITLKVRSHLPAMDNFVVAKLFSEREEVYESLRNSMGPLQDVNK